MAFLFGPSLEERAHLVQTLRALGPTTVDGLAAALGWSLRRTERMVVALQRRGEGGLYYDLSTRRIQVGRPADPLPQAVPAPAPEPAVSASPPLPGHPATPSPASTTATAAAPPERTLCPTCRKKMVPTVTGEAIVCPQCGRLSLAPSPPSSTSRPAAETNHFSSDRRAQEMFASYVTSGPILCPRCRSPLRHAGVASFRCPACGESVRIDPPASERPPLPTLSATGPRP